MKNETQLSAEQRLLLALLGSRTEARDKAEIQSLLHQVNWQNFLNITSRDLYPWVGFNLEPYRGLVEAPSEWEPLFQTRRFTAVQNLLLHRELSTILRALQESRIPVLALKGIVLAHSVYPDLSLRPMSDLDLLVPPGRREEAVRILQTLDYKYPEITQAVNRDHLPRLDPNQEMALPLRLRTSTVLVEVHSQLECCEPLFPVPVEEFWPRSALAELKGLRVQTLCPEDFLFHLCMHLSRHHRFERGLLPFVDLKLLLDSRPNWDWSRIAERSLRCGYATWMFHTMEAARDLLGVSVPGSFFQALPQPRDPTKLRRLLHQQIWSAKSLVAVPPFSVSLLAEPSWRKRALLILNRTRLVGKRELDPEPTFASFVRRARLFTQRLLAIVRTKIPLYVNAWKTGHLKLRVIRQKAALLRFSDALFHLIEEEAKCADKNYVAGFTSSLRKDPR